MHFKLSKQNAGDALADVTQNITPSRNDKASKVSVKRQAGVGGGHMMLESDMDLEPGRSLGWESEVVSYMFDCEAFKIHNSSMKSDALWLKCSTHEARPGHLLQVAEGGWVIRYVGEQWPTVRMERL